MTTTDSQTLMRVGLATRRPIASGRLARLGLAAAGLVCVFVGAAGVYVPGLPTTIFLIAAAWCFSRSCPWLEDRLIRNRFFAPFLVYLDRSRPIPRRTKLGATATMAFFVAISVSILIWRGAGPAWLPAAIVFAACVGAVFIWRWDRRHRRAGVRAGLPRRSASRHG